MTSRKGSIARKVISQNPMKVRRQSVREPMGKAPRASLMLRVPMVSGYATTGVPGSYTAMNIPATTIGNQYATPMTRLDARPVFNNPEQAPARIPPGGPNVPPPPSSSRTGGLIGGLSRLGQSISRHFSGGPAIPNDPGVGPAVQASVNANVRNLGPSYRTPRAERPRVNFEGPTNLNDLFNYHRNDHRQNGDPVLGPVDQLVEGPSYVYIPMPNTQQHRAVPINVSSRTHGLENTGSLNPTGGMNIFTPFSNNARSMFDARIQPGFFNYSNVPTGVHPQHGMGIPHGGHYHVTSTTPGHYEYIQAWEEPTYTDLAPPPEPFESQTGTGTPQLITSQGIPMRKQIPIQFQL